MSALNQNMFSSYIYIYSGVLGPF